MDSLSIGAVVRLTGISADTLRTWERRYGFPTPARNEAGHRRYDRSVFERLVQVKGLVAQGHRPSEVIRMSDAALAAAAGQRLPTPSPRSEELTCTLPVPERAAELRGAALLKTERMDAAGLSFVLETAWHQLTPHPTMDLVIVPLLAEVGQRWRAGRLGIHHEHLFSSRVAAFLSRFWQPAADANAGPVLALATPPGEEHELGLHVAATYFAMEGTRIVFLGQNTPADALLKAAADTQAYALAISVSVFYPKEQTASYLQELLRSFPGERVLLGGSGALGVRWPCVQLNSYNDIRAWLYGHLSVASEAEAGAADRRFTGRTSARSHSH